MEVNEILETKIRRVECLIMDVDGVLTDGRVIIDDLGNESKHFNVRDGHGIKLLLRTGIEVMLLTGRTSRVVEHRARELGIKEVHQGAKNKVEVLDAIMQNRDLEREEIAYIGDDIVDVPVFHRVGFSVAVADACEDAVQHADYVTRHKGGKGAVREVCELILKVKGQWVEAVTRYEIA